jgi:PhoPQ-activated pathogenicity-related protein
MFSLGVYRTVKQLLCVVVIALVGEIPLRADETALDRYVAKPDPTYEWKVVRTVETGGQTQFIVDLKSQTWRSTKDVDRPVWQHWLMIVKPSKPASKLAFLRISGGANGGEPPKSADSVSLKLAETTNSVIAELRMVPNQPLVLNGDGVRRTEDDFIAYTWDQFLKTGRAGAWRSMVSSSPAAPSAAGPPGARRRSTSASSRQFPL